MEVGHRIREYRKQLDLSQEDLAESVYVSRQTISNWENNKSYPDIHSLLRLSEIFETSLDTLIKGDIDIMKEKIEQADVKRFEKQGIVYLTALVIGLVALAILFHFFSWLGLIIWLPLGIWMAYQAYKTEKLKDSLDIHTYREIKAFVEYGSLDKVDKAVEKGKLPYQKLLWLIGSGILGFVFAYLFMTFLSALF